MARRIYSVATLAVALAVMYLAWPASLGGSTRYVVTSGISMEPLFHSGDLAILRPAAEYKVGDIAGYRSASLHVVVLHRIAERRSDRFVFKGDHNTWLDGDDTRRADILGRLRVRIPHGGFAMHLVSRPAVLLFAGGLVIMGGSETRRRRRARRARSPSSPGNLTRVSGLDSLGDRLPRQLRRPPRWAATAAGAAGAVMLALGALAWMVPSTVQRAQLVRFQQQATFSYHAQVAPNAVYPSGTLRLPDPVFLRLAPALDVTIEYDAGQLLAGGQGLGGSYAVYADLQGANGWARRFTLQAETGFTGAEFRTAVRLSPEDYLKVIAEVHRLTGTGGGSYSIAVTTEVTLASQVSGTKVAQHFGPSVTFGLNPRQLLMQDKANPGAHSVEKSQPGSLIVTQATALRLPLPGHPPLAPIRIVAPVLAGLAFLAAGLLAVHRRRPVQPAATLEIPRKYRQRVMPTEVATIPEGRTVMTVRSIGSLHRIAERYDRFIMHAVPPPAAPDVDDTGTKPPGTRAGRRAAPARGQEHMFLVDDDTAVYVFVTHVPATPGGPPSPGPGPAGTPTDGGTPPEPGPTGPGPSVGVRSVLPRHAQAPAPPPPGHAQLGGPTPVPGPAPVPSPSQVPVPSEPAAPGPPAAVSRTLLPNQLSVQTREGCHRHGPRRRLTDLVPAPRHASDPRSRTGGPGTPPPDPEQPAPPSR